MHNSLFLYYTDEMQIELKKQRIDKKLKSLNISDIYSKIDGSNILLIHKTSKEKKVITAAYFYSFLKKQTCSTHQIFPKTRILEVINEINKMGKKSDSPYVCTDYKKQKCLVKCLQSSKKKWIFITSLQKGTHPFKAVASGTSTGELSVIHFLEKILSLKFEKVRPDFLKNPKTGLNLELDGFNEKMKIAIEYGSHKQAHKNSYLFSDQDYVKFKDNFKKKKCKENGIKLLQIPDIGSKSPSLIKKELKEILEKNKVEYNLSKIEETPFIYKEKNGTYKVKDIWNVVNQCKNRDYFERNFRGYWRAAERLGVINDVVAHFKKKRSSEGLRQDWSTESVLSLCQDLGKKGKSFAYFVNEFSGAYKFARANNLIEQIKTLCKPSQKSWGYWLNLDVAEKALNECKNKRELQLKFSALYTQIRTNPTHYKKLLKKHPKFNASHIKTMTHEEIKKDLKGLTYYSDVYKKRKPTYEYLKRHNLLEKYTSHLIDKNQLRSNEKTKNENSALKRAQKYSSVQKLKEHNFTLWRYIEIHGLKDQVLKFLK